MIRILSGTFVGLFLIAGSALASGPEKSPRMLVHLLDYLALDYSVAVSPEGKVLSKSEYDEQIEFADLALEIGTTDARLKSNPEIAERTRKLRAIIERKVKPDEVARLAQETKRVVEAEGRRCLLAPGDLTEAGFCAELVERCVKELGGIDILISNAAHQNRKQLDELDPEEFDRTFKTNVYAYYYLAKAAVTHMKRGSSIIATSSSTGFRGNPELPDYSATKGAINQFTKVLAQQLVEKGIRVNAVAPGPVWTPLNPADEGASPEDVSKFGAKTPLGRPAQPEEVAPAYVFLASEADSSYITGIILPILGGETIGG